MPVNEEVRSYAPRSPERASILKKLEELSKAQIEIPCIIDGKEVFTGNTKTVVMPHAHRHVLAKAHFAGPKELAQASESALKAKKSWESLPQKARTDIFLKAAELLAGPKRDLINAATMMGQSKSIYQAEIDSACEFIDFLRFNAYFVDQLSEIQPLSTKEIHNRLEYRALEGYVLAITPFNFTAIAGNLPTAPAFFGNTAVWKPSDTQLFSAYHSMKLFEEAGLPPGVINFVPAEGPLTSEVLVKNKNLAGIHFTGSTKTFQTIWRLVGEEISRYHSYPRVVGETGGKDFVFIHESSDPKEVVTGLIRGAFEYQGQKCSAASRAYIPQSLWPQIEEQMIEELKTIKVGDTRDFSCFMNAVIDEKSFDKITTYIENAKKSPDCKLVFGGGSNKKEGFFIEPTVFQTTNPHYTTMCEEIFGPVLTIYVYENKDLEATIDICESTSPYALTGGIFSKDEKMKAHLLKKLTHAAGNVYINDKPTGAVVGQQPFGGGRASGTNDKAGSIFNLIRWTSPRTIKETLVPPKNYRYPFLEKE